MSRLLCLTELLRRLSPRVRQHADGGRKLRVGHSLPGSAGFPRSGTRCTPQATISERKPKIKGFVPNGHGNPGHAEPRPSSRPPSVTAGELVRNSTTPPTGAWISSCTVAPSMLVTVPSS
jgi:hypothetical protein